MFDSAFNAMPFNNGAGKNPVVKQKYHPRKRILTQKNKNQTLPAGYLQVFFRQDLQDETG